MNGRLLVASAKARAAGSRVGVAGKAVAVVDMFISPSGERRLPSGSRRLNRHPSPRCQTRLALHDSKFGVVDACLSDLKGSHCRSRALRGPASRHRPVTEIRAPQKPERQGDQRQAALLVGREVEMERISAFLTSVRTSGGALL